jgi:hypothetical protein
VIRNVIGTWNTWVIVVGWIVLVLVCASTYVVERRQKRRIRDAIARVDRLDAEYEALRVKNAEKLRAVARPGATVALSLHRRNGEPTEEGRR